ncbi:(protein-PII) uridylyltransferase [Mycolicibacterium phlei]|jgi:[protein-PII] uridylyltransferase|uniref:Bifunctional uridylyltransferase/uridylyl-removing enzyme n=1 Tax=Mycolicibacterium phlei DSM 43239 = CCUG 21000 TaxID=1226750 RepID=A0A5N5V714_MYCPH|nr:[protein-PII] uridylyltransferase [Mycolicibacterium phlei]VEG09033.1 (protein-PII) uridylyltransferase [Mycobacteroides chelonae]AMO60917.1 Bifunctional uridylyltransferase/uridylyl-removing enzyme [Mycolicibacterium phlei]EID12514.1 PII uridylyl-transferase [Mycolicibacterium phlei RIVM601174]KAB7756807.1 PII uridylyl-transferase [Mycolicibacterium phlei DSM 43239 = CCUG 21000]KXW66714.1 PII uridylyl-transferase [Mycolicibacterium phlei DSM 43239 = CCUG 21000]
MIEKRETAAGASRKEAPAAAAYRPATDLAVACEKLLSGTARQLDSASLRRALQDLHEFWLTTKASEIGITPTSGFAIVATGGLGRGELVPHSDLDLTLLHDNLPQETVSKVAEALWYPLWDANIRIDHSVRTVPEALKVAGEDISAGLAMLEARHIAGDSDLSSLLIGGARRQWRTGIASRFDELVEHTRARWERSGEIAHRAEPDLKCGRGGLRDVQLLNALAIAQLTDVYPNRSSASPIGSLGDAHMALLNVRTELHRVAGRGRDLLLAQHADEIGAALHIGDRFDLARMLSDAARTISFYVDAGIRTAANALPRRGFAALRRPARRPLDEGVIEFAGEVVLARDARPERDPGLILRVAAASATTGLPMSGSTLARLAESAPELRTPWPAEALKDLLVMLAAGPSAVATIEALDRTGLWGRLFPEWGAVRDLPPRDVVHIWTVDRHLVETVSKASAFTTQVSRPDLLLLGALCHDIGKGRGGDHSVIGAELATQIGTRLGLWPSDIETLSKMVRHHLLLPHTAVRRDLQDPATIASVVETLDGDPVLLELLAVLAQADSLATGPGVWGDWKATLIGDLVRRCKLVMAGEELPKPDPIDPRYLSLAAQVDVHVEMTQTDSPHIYNVTLIAPDRRGLLSKAAGVLALHSLRVHSASVNSHEGSAINTFVVSPRFGTPPAAELLRQQLLLALDGDLDVLEALDRRERDAAEHGTTRAGEIPAAVPINQVTAAPVILWSDGARPGELVVQIRSTDRTGLLARLTAVFERDGVDIVWAKVTTLGSSVVDLFGIRADASIRADLERDLYAVLPAPPPKKPAAEAS